MVVFTGPEQITSLKIEIRLHFNPKREEVKPFYIDIKMMEVKIMEYPRTIEVTYAGDLKDYYARYLLQQQLQQKLNDTLEDALEECEDDIFKSIAKALR